MLDMLASSPVSRAMGLALLHFLWQGAVIGGATAWLLHHLRSRSARARYLVGCLALLAMAAAPAITTWRGLSDPVAGSHAQKASGVDVLDLAMTPAATSVPRPVPATDLARGTNIVSSVRGLAARALPLVVVGWAVGVLVLTLQLAGGWIVIRRLRRTATPVGERLRQRAVHLAGRLGITRAIALSESMSVDVPTLIGWLRPMILIPTSVLTGLRPADLDAILAHELAHVRRHDYLVNVLQSVIETLLFYHPAVWWVSHRVRAEREHCCDDMVVLISADPVGYARALTALEELRSHTPPFALAATGGDLLGRIRRVLGTPAIDEPRSSAWSALTVVLAILPIIVVGGTSEHAAQTRPEPQAEVHLAQVVGPDPTIAPEVVRPVSLDLPMSSVTPEVLDLPMSSVTPEVLVPAGLAPIDRLTRTVLTPAVQIQTPASATRDQAAVLALEEQFRLAKVKADLTAMDRLYDPSIIATNQNGNTRNKQELLELWSTFRIQLLTLDSAHVQIVGDLATVTGQQTEINATGTDKMLFTRMWRRVGDSWKLISVTQFRDPRESENVPRFHPMITPVQNFQFRYEVFKNDALLGGNTMTISTGESSTIEIPGEPPVGVSVTSTPFDQVNLSILPRVPGTRATDVAPRGTEPAEASWKSGANTYRLRIWRGL